MTTPSSIASTECPTRESFEWFRDRRELWMKKRTSRIRPLVQTTTKDHQWQEQDEATSDTSFQGQLQPAMMPSVLPVTQSPLLPATNNDEHRQSAKASGAKISTPAPPQPTMFPSVTSTVQQPVPADLSSLASMLPKTSNVLSPTSAFRTMDRIETTGRSDEDYSPKQLTSSETTSSSSSVPSTLFVDPEIMLVDGRKYSTTTTKTPFNTPFEMAKESDLSKPTLPKTTTCFIDPNIFEDAGLSEQQIHCTIKRSNNPSIGGRTPFSSPFGVDKEADLSRPTLPSSGCIIEPETIIIGSDTSSEQAQGNSTTVKTPFNTPFDTSMEYDFSKPTLPAATTLIIGPSFIDEVGDSTERSSDVANGERNDSLSFSTRTPFNTPFGTLTSTDCSRATLPESGCLIIPTTIMNDSNFPEKPYINDNSNNPFNIPFGIGKPLDLPKPTIPITVTCRTGPSISEGVDGVSPTDQQQHSDILSEDNISSSTNSINDSLTDKSTFNAASKLATDTDLSTPALLMNANVNSSDSALNNTIESQGQQKDSSLSSSDVHSSVTLAKADVPKIDTHVLSPPVAATTSHKDNMSSHSNISTATEVNLEVSPVAKTSVHEQVQNNTSSDTNKHVMSKEKLTLPAAIINDIGFQEKPHINANGSNVTDEAPFHNPIEIGNASDLSMPNSPATLSCKTDPDMEGGDGVSSVDPQQQSYTTRENNVTFCTTSIDDNPSSAATDMNATIELPTESVFSIPTVSLNASLDPSDSTLNAQIVSLAKEQQDQGRQKDLALSLAGVPSANADVPEIDTPELSPPVAATTSHSDEMTSHTNISAAASLFSVAKRSVHEQIQNNASSETDNSAASKEESIAVAGFYVDQITEGAMITTSRENKDKNYMTDVAEATTLSSVHRDRLIEFYKKYNPSKLNVVDKNLQAYNGREEELFANLEEKYCTQYLSPCGEGPMCFLDFGSRDGTVSGKVTIQLFADKAPMAAENFRCLCTGEKGRGRKGKPLCYARSQIHRVVPSMCVQGGDFTLGDGTGGESIYPPLLPNQTTDLWGKFKDDKPFLAHDRKGLLSMANSGPNTNESQFFITLNPAPHLNGRHVVFGIVMEGMDIIEKIGALETNSKERPHETVTIIDCGEIITRKDEKDSTMTTVIQRASETEQSNTLSSPPRSNTMSTSVLSRSSGNIRVSNSGTPSRGLFGASTTASNGFGISPTPFSSTFGSTTNGSNTAPTGFSPFSSFSGGFQNTTNNKPSVFGGLPFGATASSSKSTFTSLTMGNGADADNELELKRTSD